MAANYRLKNECNAELVLAIDFQMVKLVPHWGRLAQPGKTYYYQKIMHHIFGIVDCSNCQNHVYVVDETVQVIRIQIMYYLSYFTMFRTFYTHERGSYT